MNNQLPTLELVIASLKEHGSYSGSYQPTGFWSDVIQFSIQPRCSCELKFRMSHSSGGRDEDEVPCDVEAERNMAHAMMMVSESLLNIKQRTAELNEAYQVWYQGVVEESRLRTEARNKRLETELPIGEEEAKKVVKTLKDKASKLQCGQLVRVLFKRPAEDYDYRSTVSCDSYGRIRRDHTWTALTQILAKSHSAIVSEVENYLPL